MAGIGDERHTGVRDDEDGAAAGGIDKLRGTLGLVVVEVGDDLAGNLHAERRGEIARAARVLRRDDVCLGKRLHKPRGRVPDIAQRSGGKDNPAGQRFKVRESEIRAHISPAYSPALGVCPLDS